MPGVVTGRPLVRLRVEGLAVAAVAFAVPTVGAWTYDLAHTAPLALLAAGAGWDSGALTVAGAPGLFRLGVDRALVHGAKQDHAFGATHPGVHG